MAESTHHRKDRPHSAWRRWKYTRKGLRRYRESKKRYLRDAAMAATKSMPGEPTAEVKARTKAAMKAVLPKKSFFARLKNRLAGKRRHRM